MKPEVTVSPFHKGKSMLFGSALAFWLDPIQFMQNLLSPYQDFLRIRLGYSHVYIVHSCPIVKHILKKANYKYVGMTIVTRSIKSVSDENLRALFVHA